MLNATFNNISGIKWWSVLIVEENGGPGETTNLSQVSDKLCLLQTEQPTICMKKSSRVRVVRNMKVIITTYFYIYREHLARIMFKAPV
jgi:hypothetical protein